METNNDKSKKFSQEEPVIRQILYVKTMQVSVTTNGHCSVKITAIN